MPFGKTCDLVELYEMLPFAAAPAFDAAALEFLNPWAFDGGADRSIKSDVETARRLVGLAGDVLDAVTPDLTER